MRSSNLKLVIRGNDRLNLFGRTGSGKTTQAKRMLASTSARWVVLDPKHFFRLPGAKIVNRFQPGIDHQIIRISPRDPDAVLKWDDAMWQIWEAGNRIVYIDELKLMAPSALHLRPALGALIQTGRERGIGAWVGSQRPKMLPSEVFTETEHFILFQLGFEDDRKKVCSFTSPVLEQPLADLRGHDFIYWDELHDRGNIVRAA